MKVLVTGATGFIGSRLLLSLRSRGFLVETVTRSRASELLAQKTENGWSILWPDGLSLIDFSLYDAVVHLAIPKGTFQSAEAESSLHLAALSSLLAGLAATNQRCNLVFLSSQSATPQAVSGYGRGKWACEELLRQSTAPFTIVRPGLVVSRDAPSGLCGSIVKVARISPVVPVPHSSSLVVQPIDVSDVVQGIEAILCEPGKYIGREISLALSPRSLPDLVRDLCWELQMRRWVVPVPLAIASGFLAVVEVCLPGFPIRRDNLLGLMLGQPLQETRTEDNLGFPSTQFGLPKPSWHTQAKRLWEARFLSRWFFKKEPTPRMIDRYVSAHLEIPHLQTGPLSDLAGFSRNGFIVEAAERITRSVDSPLSTKFQVLSYAAEIEPSFRSLFLLDARNRAAAWIFLTLSALYTGLLIVIGKLLMWTGKIPQKGQLRSAHES